MSTANYCTVVVTTTLGAAKATSTITPSGGTATGTTQKLL